MASAEAAPAADALGAQAAALSLDHKHASSLPLWFKPELFLQPDFSSSAYVADLRRYVRRPWGGAAPAANRTAAPAARRRRSASHACPCAPLAGAAGDAEQRAAGAPGGAEEQAGGGGCWAAAGGHRWHGQRRRHACWCVPPSTDIAQHPHRLPAPPAWRQVINEDYNDFVSLSTKLVNVDGALARMQAPLQELQARPRAARAPAECCMCSRARRRQLRRQRWLLECRHPPCCTPLLMLPALQEKLEAARGGIAAQAEELASGLQRRQAVAAARALLELMQVGGPRDGGAVQCAWAGRRWWQQVLLAPPPALVPAASWGAPLAHSSGRPAATWRHAWAPPRCRTAAR